MREGSCVFWGYRLRHGGTPKSKRRVLPSSLRDALSGDDVVRPREVLFRGERNSDGQAANV